MAQILVVVLAVTTSANWISSKPRFLLPAVLALPVARLLAPAADRGAGPARRGADRGHDVVLPLRDGDREVDGLAGR